jgi:hypothetical protein
MSEHNVSPLSWINCAEIFSLPGNLFQEDVRTYLKRKINGVLSEIASTAQEISRHLWNPKFNLL